MARTMQALVTAPNKTAVVADIAVPEPGHNEIRVKVHSVALNLVDARYTQYPLGELGRVVGSDISGVVDKVGAGVTGWQVGDRVAGLLQGATSVTPRPGGFAEYAILEQDLAIHVPAGITFDEAATVPLCALTAAQALFIRLEIPAPFPNPYTFAPPATDAPSVLVYSAATSLGLYTIELASLLRTPSGKPYRIFATASPKHHAKLLALGAEAVFDYRSPTWVEDVRKVSGGISYAVDCISENESTALISQTFVESGGKIAVIRSKDWDKGGISEGVTPLYGAVWQGLGHELIYNDATLPASPSWRAFSVAFYKFLSAGSAKDRSLFPISPNPVRLMPGGLAEIVSDAFMLIGAYKVVDRPVEATSEGAKEWMNPADRKSVV